MKRQGTLIPKPIEAIQYTGDNVAEVLAFANEHQYKGHPYTAEIDRSGELVIQTYWTIINIVLDAGDWIVREMDRPDLPYEVMADQFSDRVELDGIVDELPVECEGFIDVLNSDSQQCQKNGDTLCDLDK